VAELDPNFIVLCPGSTTTREPSFEESKWAETIVWINFAEDFVRRYDRPRLVLGQLDYLHFETSIKVLNDILKRMAENFRNELARAPLQKDIRSNRPGRNLKPDVLGIAVTTHEVVLELVEVTTFQQADRTLVEDVEHKLRALRDKVLTEDTSGLESNFFLRSGGRTPFVVGPSKWRPKWSEMVYPLLPSTGRAANDNASRKFEWICYWPTFRFNPTGTAGVGGVDGLILYEIHSVSLPSPIAIPEEVLKKLRDELRRKAAQQRLASQTFTLTPWITEDYWKINSGDRAVLLAVATAAGIALVAYLAIEFFPVVTAIGVAEAIGTLAADMLAAVRMRASVLFASEVMQSIGRPVAFGALRSTL
jgi:hypothetical protein